MEERETFPNYYIRLPQKKAFIATLSVVSIVACFVFSSFQIVTAINDITSIENARSSINCAFTNVLEAEKAGGNTTVLLQKLNEAGDLLAAAENTQRSGDSTGVASKAESARQIADQVKDDAIKLLNNTLAESKTNFWLTIAFSTIGAVAFALILWVVWKRFKRHFMNRLLDMKPEVIEDAA